MSRIKKGDTVVVIAGGDKGKTGEVLRVIPSKNQAVVQGVRIQTKHQKPSMASPQGGIIKREAPIDLSNIMLVDPGTSKPTRVKVQTLADGKKVRAGKSGEQLDK
jgi:large subunit ribosomal protein L24